MAQSKPTKVVVTEKYCNLLSKLGTKGEMREVEVFYHVTKNENKEDILRTGKIEKRLAIGFDKGQFNACPINDNLSGVYLSVRLEDDGQLPKSSPYGNERIRIPIDHLLTPNMHLFFAWQYILHGKKLYAILVLVDESKKGDLEFCYDHLVPLNMHDNPILCLRSTRWCVTPKGGYTSYTDTDTDTKPEGPFDMRILGAALPGETTEPKHLVHVNLEVEIFLVGDIKLAKWDRVNEGNRARPPPPASLSKTDDTDSVDSDDLNVAQFLQTSDSTSYSDEASTPSCAFEST